MKPVSYLGDVIAALFFSGRQFLILAFEFYHNKNASSSQPSLVGGFNPFEKY